jgi:hypothetical protein
MASSKKKPAIITKSTNDIPEVAEFLAAMGRLEAFRQQHPDIFAEFDKYIDDYNTKLEMAEKTVRAEGVSCGPFELYQFGTKYDAKNLYDLVGHERFFTIGGSTSTQTVYEVDPQKVEMAIEQGKIPADVVDSFRTVTPRYHAPKKLGS